MTLVKVGDDRYINVDRMTYTESSRKGKLLVHFAVGGGDVGGPACVVKLEADEAVVFRRWLDSQAWSPKDSGTST